MKKLNLILKLKLAMLNE